MLSNVLLQNHTYHFDNVMLYTKNAIKHVMYVILNAKEKKTQWPPASTHHTPTITLQIYVSKHDLSKGSFGRLLDFQCVWFWERWTWIGAISKIRQRPLLMDLIRYNSRFGNSLTLFHCPAIPMRKVNHNVISNLRYMALVRALQIAQTLFTIALHQIVISSFKIHIEMQSYK